MPYSEPRKPVKKLIFYCKGSVKYVWITKLLFKIVLSFISKNRLETLDFAGKISKSWFFLKAADKDSIISYGKNLIFCFIKLCHRMHDWKAKHNILEEVMELLACSNNCPTLSYSKVVQLGRLSCVKNQLHFVVRDYVFFSACCHVICTCFINCLSVRLSTASARTIT